MKKFTKITLILSGFFVIVGVVSIICALAMGMTWNGLRKMVQDGELSIQLDDWDKDSSFLEYEHHNSHKSGNCKKLDIDLAAAKLNLFYDNVEEIQVKQDGIKKFSSRVNGDTLEIDGGKGIFTNGSNGVVTIILPKGTEFEEVELNIGAGQADIDELCAKKVSVEVGAGQANFSYLDTKKFEAETGAGQITAHLVEGEEAYSYDAACGIGEIQIGNSSISGLGGEKDVTNPGADRYLEVECGVGQIIITFQK